jgi:hypothetical protein
MHAPARRARASGQVHGQQAHVSGRAHGSGQVRVRKPAHVSEQARAAAQAGVSGQENRDPSESHSPWRCADGHDQLVLESKPAAPVALWRRASAAGSRDEQTAPSDPHPRPLDAPARCAGANGRTDRYRGTRRTRLSQSCSPCTPSESRRAYASSPRSGCYGNQAEPPPRSVGHGPPINVIVDAPCADLNCLRSPLPMHCTVDGHRT